MKIPALLMVIALPMSLLIGCQSGSSRVPAGNYSSAESQESQSSSGTVNEMVEGEGLPRPK